MQEVVKWIDDCIKAVKAEHRMTDEFWRGWVKGAIAVRARIKDDEQKDEPITPEWLEGMGAKKAWYAPLYGNGWWMYEFVVRDDDIRISVEFTGNADVSIVVGHSEATINHITTRQQIKALYLALAGKELEAQE